MTIKYALFNIYEYRLSKTFSNIMSHNEYSAFNRKVIIDACKISLHQMRSRAEKILTQIWLITILYCYSTFNLSSVNAELSSFPRQEMNDGISDGLFTNSAINSSNQRNDITIVDDAHDIKTVTHFSDGKTLNATLWLLGNISKDPDQMGASSISYGILIDVDNNPSTGRLGVDFQKETKWTKNSSNWISSLIEFSSSGRQKIKILESNFSIIEEQPFFPISIDLSSITSPDRFRVAYYSIFAQDNSKNTVDITNWIDVPPAKFSLSTLPNTITLTQGENLDVGVHIISNTGISPRVLNFIPDEDRSPVSVQFNPNGINITSFGLAPSPFRITTAGDTPVGEYTIPISANVSVEYGRQGIISIPGTNASLTGNGYITIKPNITVSVVERPPFGQEFKDFWTTYGQVISLFGAGFAGGFSTHIMDRIKERREEKKKAKVAPHDKND